MERKKVNSSTLRSVGYDEKQQILEIEFTGSSIYQYSGVPGEVYRRFMSSPSLVSYYRDNIEEAYNVKRVR
ncbi:MAG: KTSC domain-containing protein [Burkholderiales bacterium]